MLDETIGGAQFTVPDFTLSPSHPLTLLEPLTPGNSSAPAVSNPGVTIAADPVKPSRALTWPEATTADAALVQECVGGDDVACAQLVTDHQRMVYQLGLNLLGDPQEALDLCQEVFLRVFRMLHQFRGQSTLRTWIYRIALNQASNRLRWWRRRHKAQQVSLEDAPHGDLPEQRHSSMPDRVLQQREVAGRVWGALDKLPFDQRAVIILREIDGLSYEEIAASLDVAVGTVKSRLARAREELRHALKAV
jgi:RNA polymerase sigma-70 factor (ECF subfamily)